MPDIGEQATDFELKNQAGDLVKLSDFRGKKIVLLFDGDKRDTAEKAKDKYPTFIYKSSKESNPTIESALLYGLDDKQQAETISDFQSLPECKNCTVWKNNIGNCLKKNGCPLKDSKTELKAKLNRSCLKKYYEAKTFPPAFKQLLDKIDLQNAIRSYIENLSGITESSPLELANLLEQHEKAYSFLKLIHTENIDFETAKNMLNLNDKEIDKIIEELLELKLLEYISDDEIEISKSGIELVTKK